MRAFGVPYTPDPTPGVRWVWIVKKVPKIYSLAHFRFTFLKEEDLEK
jgi:hypothetical protein